MKGKDLIKIIEPYCDKIRFNGKHYTCYPKEYDRTITISASPSDRNREHQVFRDFRRYANIIINELEKR